MLKNPCKYVETPCKFAFNVLGKTVRTHSFFLKFQGLFDQIDKIQQ